MCAVNRLCTYDSVPHANSILQRAGVVPMSIAGIAKEVTTISVSAWFFGDQLSPLNITGAAITVCGECFNFDKGI